MHQPRATLLAKLVCCDACLCCPAYSCPQRFVPSLLALTCLPECPCCGCSASLHRSITRQHNSCEDARRCAWVGCWLPKLAAAGSHSCPASAPWRVLLHSPASMKIRWLTIPDRFLDCCTCVRFCWITSKQPRWWLPGQVVCFRHLCGCSCCSHHSTMGRPLPACRFCVSPAKRFCDGLSRVGGCTAGHGLAHLVGPAGPLDSLFLLKCSTGVLWKRAVASVRSHWLHTRTQTTPNSTNCTWQWQAVVWASPAFLSSGQGPGGLLSACQSVAFTACVAALLGCFLHDTLACRVACSTGWLCGLACCRLGFGPL